MLMDEKYLKNYDEGVRRAQYISSHYNVESAYENEKEELLLRQNDVPQSFSAFDLRVHQEELMYQRGIVDTLQSTVNRIRSYQNNPTVPA